jgi:phenylacetate-CoA ligase
MKPPRRHAGLEFEAPEVIRRTQAALLREHVAHCVEHSPFYRRQAREWAVAPDRVTLETLPQLPLTGKDELGPFNDDFLAVAPEAVVDIVLSSGTTGKASRIFYTEHDLQRLAYNEEISFAGCGVTARDVALLTCTMDRCFVAGLAYFLGLRALGAATIRNGHGSLDSHLELIRSARPTVLVGVPSFLRKLAQHLNARGVPADRAGVRALVCIGEPLRDAQLHLLPLGRDLERLWAGKAYSTYASSEVVTTFCECTAQQGGHLHPDLGILEIVDAQGRPTPDGQPGEIVITPLQVEGMPFLRFRTGDIGHVVRTPCPCGRTSPRLSPILGRQRQMMKVRGTSLYPPAVFAALDELPQVAEYYVAVSGEDDLSDDLAVHVALGPAGGTAEEIAGSLQAKLRVKPQVVIEPLDAVRQVVFNPESRKPIRFVDRRRRA